MWNLIAFIFCLSAQASNFHEHLPTLASYEDYVVAFQSIGASLPQQKLTAISKTPGRTVISVFGEDVALALVGEDVQGTLEEAVTRRLTGLSVRETADLVAAAIRSLGRGDASSEGVVRSFFEFTPLNLRGDAAYLAIGWDVRIQTQNQLHASGAGFVELFKSYLRRTPLSERKVVTLTASAAFDIFNEDRAAQMVQLKKLFAEHGSHLEIFAGIGRAEILRGQDADFLRDVESLKKALNAGIIAGVDVTGSIYEGAEQEQRLDPATIERGRKRLVLLFGALAGPARARAQIKIHAYEASAEGGFYELLFGAIDDAASAGKLPAVIRIGHINKLPPTDIRRFGRLQRELPVRFVFEANAHSNIFLKGATMARIAKKMDMIDREGLTVVLGTDGAGIFGTSSRYSAALASLIEAGLARATATRVKSQSHFPFFACEALLIL